MCSTPSSVLWALLAFGWSAGMRDFAGRLTNRRPLQTALYWIQFILYMSIVTFPLAVYSDFYREHQYGLATQTFWPWMGDQLKGLGLGLVLGGLAVMVLYGVLRRVGRSWWLWATGVVVAFSIFGAIIAPVFIAPVFNTYTRLTDARLRDPILSMARANGIGVDAVYVVDQSRQTTRISANVSGLFGTTRVSLNDNLLRRASLEEIEAVLGHEMGHYVLNHVLKDLIQTSLVIAAGFALIARGFERLRQRRPRWRIAEVGDVAGLPLIALLWTVYQFMATPILNTIIRTSEYEADIFGLNASRQPDGFASVSLKLGEYRKLDPGPIEELIFFDHPSGRTRIFSAMRWKAEHSAVGSDTLGRASMEARFGSTSGRICRQQPEIARLEVGVERVGPVALPVERSEQPAFRYVEGRRHEVARPQGRVDAPVVFRASDIDREIARVQLDVLVALDAFDRQVAGGEANMKTRSIRDLDLDFEAVPDAIGHQRRLRSFDVGVDPDARQVVGVPHLPQDANTALFRARDVIAARRQVHANSASGGERALE
jgi:STE24 endopeptidase